MPAVAPAFEKEIRFKVDLTPNRTPSNASYVSFASWLTKICTVTDKDRMRTDLYYGFQPLVDLLLTSQIEGELEPEQGEAALKLFDHLIKISSAYLKRYYTSEVKAMPRFTSLAPLIKQLPSSYQLKARNIGMYDDSTQTCLPKNIQSFLKNILEQIKENKIVKPDYIIGCACGASELALSLSALLDVDVDFIRRSKRRYDAMPKIIQEHLARIKRRAKNKNVLVIEDFVCSGNTLQKVMEKVKTFSPSCIQGAALIRNTEYDIVSSLTQLIHTEDLYVYIPTTK